MKIGFDNDKYLKMQSEHIRERIGQFGNKLYLEFGGKLFDDYHASRVLPGFEPDSKLRMLMQLSDQAEIVIVISANDIDKNKIRGDLGITYDEDVRMHHTVLRPGKCRSLQKTTGETGNPCLQALPDPRLSKQHFLYCK